MAKEANKKTGGKGKEGITVEVQAPEGITLSLNGRDVTATGPQGSFTRKIQSRRVSARQDSNKVVLTTLTSRKKELALINTERGNLRNMIHGVRDKATYKMKVLFSHFPMGLKVQGNTLLIDNFLGEKNPRKAVLYEGVKVDIKGQDVTITGINKDAVAQTAANIEQSTKIRKLDPRVFQDGIYIIEKDGKPVR
ncbi:MAG: 50S ribosomal protein L6 [Candidatus Altiarchaeota archaeon]|nr:50S ribosomal protein L6 [Candidatus Altiarchaeota archaeon]